MTNVSREKILQNLRASRSPFEDAPPRPATYLPVTELNADERGNPVKRFAAEVERLNGEVHVASSPKAATECVLGIVAALGEVQCVMAWENLPLPSLEGALAARGIQVVHLHARGDSSRTARQGADPIRIGITGAEAAFATTGTLVLPTGTGNGRLPSLLPPVHIALLPRDHLFPRMEDWLSVHGRRVLAESNSVSFVSGPSRTGDIEMQIVLGVHGPGTLHIVVF